MSDGRSWAIDPRAAARAPFLAGAARLSDRQAQEGLFEAAGARLGSELLATPSPDDPAISDEQQLIAAIGLIHDVARHEKRPPGGRERPEMLPELDPQGWVHSNGGLVEEY